MRVPTWEYLVLKVDALEKKIANSLFMYGAILPTVCRVHHKIYAVYTEIDSRKQIMDLLDRGLQ
jgi:hypothetical protein